MKILPCRRDSHGALSYPGTKRFPQIHQMEAVPNESLAEPGLLFEGTWHP